jgi:hypothetical protein
MAILLGQNHRYVERFRFLDRGAPAFEAGRIDKSDGGARERIYVSQWDHSQIAKTPFEPAFAKLAHDCVELIGFPWVGSCDDNVNSALCENGQRLDHHLMVVVTPKLVRKVEEVLG